MYLGMVAVNALAALLPINGVTPAEVSDAYPNLFTPAGLTFSIWGVIYALLAAYTVYQLVSKNAPAELICRLGVLFSLSSAANIMWIFAWHHQVIPLSLVLMVLLLVCLIWMMGLITSMELTGWQLFFIKLPFAVYLGWITVATIANVTVLLVSLGWNGFGLPQQAWTMAVLTIGAIIGILAGARFQSIAYLLVFIWAYAASSSGTRRNPVQRAVSGVIMTAGVMIVFCCNGRNFSIQEDTRPKQAGKSAHKARFYDVLISAALRFFCRQRLQAFAERFAHHLLADGKKRDDRVPQQHARLLVHAPKLFDHRVDDGQPLLRQVAERLRADA
jgi:apolipoprotein N-acyltransferase